MDRGRGSTPAQIYLGQDRCQVSQGGRCVGRPQGYGRDEHCTISVSGGGGYVRPCTVFDTERLVDYITMPDGSVRDGSDCPVGVPLAPGDVLNWESDYNAQGDTVTPGHDQCTPPAT